MPVITVKLVGRRSGAEIHMNPITAIAIGFTRQVGKDTLAQRLSEVDPSMLRYSFGDEVRAEVSFPIWDWYGIDIWDMSIQDKEFTRPYLIAHGMARRAKDPDYWVKKTLNRIRERLLEFPKTIPVITDARFANEVSILRRELGAKIIHLTRDAAPEPTDEEKRHYPALIPLADHTFHWGDNTEEEQREVARRVIETIRRVAP